MLETMRYAPMNVTIGKSPVIHYTLPQAIEAGEIVRYTVGSHYSGNQVSYDYGDSHIPDSASIISEAYGAYNYFLS